MYKIGEFIIYGSSGVCEVQNIGTLNIRGVDKVNTYYTLIPIDENGKIFVPIDTKIFMRNIITFEEAERLIELIPYIEEKQCSEKNMRLLQDYYKNLLNTHDCVDLLTVISSVSDKRSNANKNGKKLGQIDERFMKMAERLINDEFSVALGIPRDEIKGYLEDKMEEFKTKQ